MPQEMLLHYEQQCNRKLLHRALTAIIPSQSVAKLSTISYLKRCITNTYFLVSPKYSLAEKANDDFFAKRQHFAELAAKGSLPLHPVQMPMDHDDPVRASDTYNPKPPGQRNKITKMHTHPLVFDSDYKTWDTNDTTIRRQAYANKRPCTVGPVAEKASPQAQHYLGQQPYFVTNSKTEVTV